MYFTLTIKWILYDLALVSQSNPYKENILKFWKLSLNFYRRIWLLYKFLSNMKKNVFKFFGIKF